MKRISITIIILVLISAADFGCATRETARYPASRGVVDVSIFYDSLSPYGRWFSVVEYGWVWSPYDVSVVWQPYTNGYWVFSDYGWTWVSNWRWGWGPFHYGRWVYHTRYGWFWIPGREWGPAWVVWRHRPGWVGWAPMPPQRGWRVGLEFDIRHDSDRSIDPYSYRFIEERNFPSRDLNRHLESPARNVTLIQETREMTDYRRTENRVINRSLEAEPIERATGRAVTRHRVTDTGSPGGGEKISGNDVRVYRPDISRSTTDRTPQTRSATPQEASRREEQENRQLQIEQERSRKVLEDRHRAEQSRAQQQAEQERIRRQQEAERRALDEQMKRQREDLKNRQDTRRQTQPTAPQRKPAEERKEPPKRTPPPKKP